MREEKKTKEKGRGNFSSCSSFSRLRDRRKQISSLSLRSLSSLSPCLTRRYNHSITLALCLPIAAVARRAACRSSGSSSSSSRLSSKTMFGSVAAVVRKRRRCRPRPLRLRLEQQEPLAPSQSRQKQQQQQQQQRASRRRPLEVTPTEERPKSRPEIATAKEKAPVVGSPAPAATAPPQPSSSLPASTAPPQPSSSLPAATAPPQPSSSLPARDQLWPLITAASQRAVENKALCPIDTAAVPERLSDGGWSFVLRVASSLKSKDDDGREQRRKEDDVTASASASAASSPERTRGEEERRGGGGAGAGGGRQERSPSPPPPPAFDPFLPYDERLWVAHLPPSHELLLNKFPVSLHHALVVTRAFEEQEDPLTAADLRAAWAVVDAMPGAGGMAFFNRGPASGASQRHKHLQIVPLPLHGAGSRGGGGGLAGGGGLGGRGGGGGASDWAPFEGVALAATAAAGAAPLSVVALGGAGGEKEEGGGNGLPFRAFAARMPPRGAPSAEALERCVAELVGAACPPSAPSSPSPSRSSSFSFNLLLTRRVAVAVPRRRGAAGPCSPNAVAFAGSMLARSEEELGFVRARGPMAILAECGFPW